MRGWSQRDLANAVGLLPSAISHLETGNRGPSNHTLIRVANALDVTTDYLLGRVDEPGVVDDPMSVAIGRLSSRDRNLLWSIIGWLSADGRQRRMAS